jgi:6-phosphogluconolactonase
MAAATPSPAGPLIVVGGYHNLVSTFVVDVTSGALTLLAESDAGTNPSYMAFRGDRAYAVNETAAGRVSAFAWDRASGKLAKLNDVPSAGDDPCHVAVDPSGAWVAAANYSSGTVALLAVTPSGALAEHAAWAPGKNAHEAHWRPGAGGPPRLYVPCLGSDAVAQGLVVPPATGAPAPLAPGVPPAAPLAPGAGPRHLAFSPDGAVAYVINELDCTVTSFVVDPVTGALGGHVHTVSTLPVPRQAGWSTAHIAASPDGRHVYASNRGHDSLAVYRVVGGAADAVRLEAAGWETGGGDVRVPRDFTLSPDGGLLVAANQAADSVTVFRRDAATGGLTKLATTALPPGRKPCYVGWVA